MTVLLELIGQLLGMARDQRMDRFNLPSLLIKGSRHALLQ